MRCETHCPQPGGGSPRLVIGAAAAVAVAAAGAAFIESVVVVILVVLGVLCVAGLGLLAWLLRPVRLSGPVRAGLPAPSRRHALGAAGPAAIESKRMVPGVVLTDIDNAGNIERRR